MTGCGILCKILFLTSVKVHVGQQAPLFLVEDIHGKQISLHEYTNQKVMLCFFRYAGCPMCNFQLSLLIERANQFEEEGLKIIAFFQSPKEDVRSIPGKQHPPFPLIADPMGAVYKLYGIEASFFGTFQPANAAAFLNATIKHHFPQKKVTGDFFLMPAEFLIGPPDATIYHVHYWSNFADPLPHAQIQQFCRLQTPTI